MWSILIEALSRAYDLLMRTSCFVENYFSSISIISNFMCVLSVLVACANNQNAEYMLVRSVVFV